MRRKILEEGYRADGRGPLRVFVPLAAVCLCYRVRMVQPSLPVEKRKLWSWRRLGTQGDEQLVDDLEGKTSKNFMLHYNFPPFSVGEVGRFTVRQDGGRSAMAP